MSSRHEMITVSARKSSGGSAPAHKTGKGKHKLKHMTVTPGANGGAVVEHHFERPDSKDGMYMPEPSPELHPFKTGKEAGKHVAGMLSASEGAGGKEAAAQTEEDEEKNEDL